MDWLVTCENSDAFIKTARDNLDQSLINSLADIKTELYPSASFVIAQPDQFTYSNYGYQTTIPQGSSRLSEIDPFVFDGMFGRGKRGLYVPKNGRIFLRKITWCRHTLIHETLHAVSTFAIPRNIKTGTLYPFLNEGLTELFSGYILWKRYPDCYVTWKSRHSNIRCTSSLSYQKIARIWYTFCRFVPFNTVNELFFNDNQLPWENQWANFLQDIANIGYIFNDPVRQNQGILEDRFLAECKRSFGEKQVEEIFEKDSYDFDFSKMIII